MIEALLEGDVCFRVEVGPGDPARIADLVTATGMFSAGEADLARELVEERLARGLASGYRFLLAERDGRLLGYACFGPIPLTRSSFDLYWIAVGPGGRHGGIGRRLIQRVERTVVELGGARLYADTSLRPDYEPSRAFYRAMGYVEAARFADFYAPGDGKIVFEKQLGAET